MRLRRENAEGSTEPSLQGMSPSEIEIEPRESSRRTPRRRRGVHKKRRRVGAKKLTVKRRHAVRQSARTQGEDRTHTPIPIVRCAAATLSRPASDTYEARWIVDLHTIRCSLIHRAR
jgi:hypothetical protein